MKHRASGKRARVAEFALALLVMRGLACSSRSDSSSHSIPPPHPLEARRVPPQSAQTLRERLKRGFGAGRPVALVASASGILAVALDARQQLLVPGDVTWLFVDDRAGVVWYQTRIAGSHELRLLDWSVPAPVPERIATGLGSEHALAVTIAYAESAHGPEEVTSRIGEYDGYARLLLTAAGAGWSYEPGLYDDIFDREAKERTARLTPLRFVATPLRLSQLNERGRGKRLLLGTARMPVPGIAKSVDRERCWDASLCGSGQALPGTTWSRVVVMHECGDACHVRYQLYDPATREFFEHTSRRRSPFPIDDGEPANVEDVWIAAGGEGFIIAGSVYDRSGNLLVRGGRRGGGWLGGQWYLD